MWFLKFFRIMPKGLNEKLSLIARTNSRRFYVENVRQFFDLNTRTAKILCEMAVKDGFFQKRIGVECPNDGRIITSYPADKAIPEEFIKCEVCEIQGEDKFTFKEEDCHKIEFYQLAETA